MRCKSRFRTFAVALWLCLAAACLSLPALAQGEYTVRVAQVQTGDYPQISLYVEVSDASGKPVADLQQADFTVTEDGQPVDIVGFAGVGDERPVDVVFVFDTTGSMREEIEGVKNTCIAFAEELESKGRDYRLGLVAFDDAVEGVYGAGGRLTDDAREFKRWIGRLKADGGNNDPENDFGALKEASQMGFRDEAQRVFILITDAPPHHYGDRPDGGVRFDDPDLTADRITAILQKQSVTVYAVAYDHGDFREIVRETGGRFYNIHTEPDFTGIIEQIGTALATQYRITYRSPRPTYDGTRRDIRVSVGAGTGVGSTGGGTYLEKHLLNIQSNPLVGAICMLPLLLVLAAPVALRRATWRRKPTPSPVSASPAGQSQMRQPPPLPSPALLTCPHCGQQLRLGAKFCPGCGQSVMVSPLPQPVTLNCPRCGYTMRAEARFCARCGYQKHEQ